jgi:hypothetical protein
MLKKPTYTGVESILSGFESMNPDGMLVFSVWHGDKDIAFQCIETDPAIQEKMLRSNLEAMAEAGNSELMYLKLHKPTGDYIDTKTKVISLIPIQVVEFQDFRIIAGESSAPRPAGMSYEAWEMMKNLKDLPATIGSIVDERIKALTDLEEEEEPEENDVQKYIGIIKGVTQDPTIMAVIGQIFNFLKPQQPIVAPGRIGMTQTQASPFQQPVQDQTAERQPIPCNEDQMNEALNRLQYHCDLGNCLMRLANMADANPAGFQQLLTMLP